MNVDIVTKDGVSNRYIKVAYVGVRPVNPDYLYIKYWSKYNSTPYLKDAMFALADIKNFNVKDNSIEV